MFVSGTSGIQHLRAQEEAAMSVSTAIKNLKDSLQTGTTTLSSVHAAIAAAQSILNSGLNQNTPFYANLKATLDSLTTHLQQCPIVMESCSKNRGGIVYITDSNGHGLTVGSLDPKATYNWSAHISRLSDFKQTGWVSKVTEDFWCRSVTDFPSDISGHLDWPDFHEDMEVYGSGNGDSVVKYGQVQMTPDAKQAVQTFLNGF